MTKYYDPSTRTWADDSTASSAGRQYYDPATKRWVRPPPPSFEQQYESRLQGLPLPKFVKNYLLPGTIGEAAGTAAGIGAMALAPETGGLSMALPVGAAALGGYLEPSDQPYLSGQRFKRAAIEGGKELGALGVGKALTAVPELITRYAAKGGMLARTAKRIGNAIPRLFNAYPFEAPVTAPEMERQIANGNLVEATGKRLGEFRDMLRDTIPEFRAAQKPQFIPASSGQPMAYSKAIRARGLKFSMPDIDAAGNRVYRDMGIGEAIDHVKKMQGLSFTASGGTKSGEFVGLYKEAAHDGRQVVIDTLNKINRPGMRDLGTRYGNLSADYGTAVNIEDSFKNAMRTSRIAGQPRGVLDQGSLLRRLNKDMPDLTRLQGAKAAEFQAAVAPTGAEAIPEGQWQHPRGTLMHSVAHILPHPYMPETRAVMPRLGRALSSRIAGPIYAVPATRSLIDPAIKPVVGPP